MRQTLYMASLSASRCNPVIRAFIDRLISNGKPYKVAMTAAMRKLITMLNAMVKKDELWRTELTIEQAEA